MRQRELPFCHPNQDQLGTTQPNHGLHVATTSAVQVSITHVTLEHEHPV
jgi:hypothetical protein